jgi:esterase/lipase superfamily enzyme
MNDSTILPRLASYSERFKAILGLEQWSILAAELAALIMRLDQSSDAPSLSRDVDRFIEGLLRSPAADLVQQALAEASEGDWSTTLRSGKGVRELKHVLLEPKDGYVVIPVFYGTDRQMTDSVDPHERYSGNRGTPGFGVARVSIPENHKVAELESKEWWQWFSEPNPKKHVVLLEAEPCLRPTFVRVLSETLAVADKRDLLVFVHGFNVRFADAARRTAQLAYDLKFPGPAMLYSWPSRADVKQYMVDAATIEWTVPHFVDFIRMGMIEVGARSVNVIAHSMGTRALVGALERLDVEGLPARLHQIILAAADIDAGVFRSIAPVLRQRVERVTLYASENDRALLVSRLLQGYPRAGDAGDRIIILDEVDTIDASKVETGLFTLNHSYFGAKRSILTDIHAILHRDLPPSERFDLQRMRCADGVYWAYKS